MTASSATPTMPATADPRLADAVDLARAAAEADTDPGVVGEHVAAQPEGEDAVTHLFAAGLPGYRGWQWAVTVASAGRDAPESPVTVSEVVLLPGPDALVAPPWVPWERRVRAGDLGVGDLLPTAPDDLRLAPAYLDADNDLDADDPAVAALAPEAGLGRYRVMSRFGRQEAAARWHHGEFGPDADQAVSAPSRCGTCGFYLPLAGSLRVAFGVCGNEFSPSDGHVVHVEHGCGAHSEVEVEPAPVAAVGELVYDDARLDVEASEPAPKPEE